MATNDNIMMKELTCRLSIYIYKVLETAVGLFPQTSFVSFPGNIMIYVNICLCISLHLTILHNKCSMFRLQYDRRTFQVIVKAEFGHVHLVYIIF